MCGICGLLALDGHQPADEQGLEAMSAALAHRGPDDAGTLVDGPAALAIRRLAIIDPAGGHQPIANEDGTVHVVLNGEIYNHAALRDRLAARGHRFATRSDTEVLVHLYEERGDAFVEDLRGMFAVAIWDARRRRLLLARDRFGIKPLVYAEVGGQLAFASETKALLALPGLPRDVDLDAFEQYLTINAVMAPHTMLAAVRKLPAGHRLVAAPGRPIRVQRWARDLPARAEDVRRAPRAELAAELRERLRDAVRAHLIADVPVGVLLSGGIDSGVICALAAQEAGPGLATFTVGFEERSFDETAAARAVAERYGTDHHELSCTAADAEHLPGLAWTFDEPRGDSTALPYWLAARHAAAHRKVVLSGEGGDELFAGYQTYAAGRLGAGGAGVAAALAPLAAALPSSSRRLSPDFRLRRLARGAGLGALERHHAFKEILSGPQRAALVAAGRRGTADPLAPHRARWAQTAGAPELARLQDVDLGTFLADDLLLQTDRAGMAHGLEIRVPFLDPVVAELALALPTSAKLRGLQTKAVLRDAAAPLLPPAVVRGPKRGFVAPAAAWLRGPLLPLARDVLSEATLRRQGFLRPAAVQALLRRHVERREDLSRPLWALLAFTLWHDAVGASVPERLASPPPQPVRSVPG
jgi:asparagine synthase (glutamine-hydrolysing)